MQDPSLWLTVERYDWSGSIQTGPYLHKPIDLPSFYDMAYNSGPSTGEVWVACDNSSYPIKAFNTDGILVGSVNDTVVPAAHGLCFEDSDLLWASDFYSDHIYRIDLNPEVSTGEISAGLSLVSLNAGTNPFSSSVMISGTGFGDESFLQVFDLTGRIVFSESFEGSFMWDGRSSQGATVSPGAYVVRASGISGSADLMLMKL